MGCEICGRSNCTRSFHSLEAQAEFDKENKTDEIKDRLKDVIIKAVKRLENEWIGDDPYVKLSDVIDAIDSAS